MNLSHLTDDELDQGLISASKNERLYLVSFLWYLHEVNRRKSYSPRFQDLKQFVRSLSPDNSKSAWRRIGAMKLLSEFPHLEELILSGELDLSTMAEIEKVSRDMEPSQKRKFLDSLKEKDSIEMDRILRPKIAKQDSVKPLSDGRFEVKLTLTKVELELIKEHRNQIAHQIPMATMSEVVAHALQTAIESLKERRSRPRAQAKASIQDENARVPNAELKRTIYRNADGKCELCKSTFAVEDDHVIPYAKGGKTTLSNLRLLCHNCHARQTFLEFGEYRKKKRRPFRSWLK